MKKPFSRNHINQDLLRVDFWRKIALQKRPPIYVKNTLLFLASLLIGFAVTQSLKTVEAIPQEAAYMGGIFIIAALLWVTEALPLFATALLVIALEVIFIANPGGWENLGFSNGESPSYKTLLAPFSDPIIYLFLGGFILAQGSVKEGVDKALASSLLKIFGGKPLWVMLGFMLVTAVFSMFMSNTATTAMMITLILPILHTIPKGDKFKKGLVLCIPFAANIGGMGTPIGSPPNAVAVGFLRSNGFEISFMQWMIIAVPLAIFLLLFAWLLVWFLYKPTDKGLNIKTEAHAIDARGYFVIAIFSITILLWLTDYYHKLPSAVVALIPAVAFTSTGIINRTDFNNLEWHILMLIAGGIALGLGMKLTGLDQIIVGLIPDNNTFVFLLLIVTTILLSTFMSNTAAANLIIPLGISFATMSGFTENTMFYGIGISLAASLAMAMPISTPPNAIAYSKGVLTTSDFIKAGTVIGAVGVLLILFFVERIVNFWLELL